MREGQLFLAFGDCSVCSHLGATLPGSCKGKQPHSRGFQVLSLGLDASARLPFLRRPCTRCGNPLVDRSFELRVSPAPKGPISS